MDKATKILIFIACVFLALGVAVLCRSCYNVHGSIGEIAGNLAGQVSDKFDDVANSIEDKLNPSFKVVSGGVEYRGSENKLTLPDSGQVVFKTQNGGKCEFRVIPVNDFEFKVDGSAYSFKNEGDFTRVFSTDILSDTFVIECAPDKYTVLGVLQAVFGSDKTIELPELEEEYYFRLDVTASTGTTVSIYLNQSEAEAGGT